MRMVDVVEVEDECEQLRIMHHDSHQCPLQLHFSLFIISKTKKKQISASITTTLVLLTSLFFMLPLLPAPLYLHHDP